MKKILLTLATVITILLGLVTQIEAYQTAPKAVQVTFKNGFNIVLDNGKVNTFKEKTDLKGYRKVKEAKENIKEMLTDNKVMITTKEGRTNVAYIKGDKVVIVQDIENTNYSFTLTKDYPDFKNTIDCILMYMTGHNAFNTNIDNVDIEFYSVEGIEESTQGTQITFDNNNGIWLEN